MCFCFDQGTFRGSDKKVLEGKFIISEITGDCMYDVSKLSLTN